MAWPQLGAIAAANAAAAVGSPGYDSPGYDSPGGGAFNSAGFDSIGFDSIGQSGGYSLTDFYDDLGVVYWLTDETGASSPTDTLNASDGDPDKAMALQAGTPTYGQTFSNYPEVTGIQFDGTAWFKGPDNLSTSDSPLVTVGDETIMVFTNFSTFTGSDFHVIFSVAGDGGTSNYNTTGEIFVGASNDFMRSRWQYSSGSTETTQSDATVPTGETLFFAVRDTTNNEVRFYYDNGGTLTQLGTTQSYTNDPTSGSGAVKAACFGGRNKTGNVKPMLSGQIMGLPGRLNRQMTSSEMQTAINLARSEKRIMRSPDTFVYAEAPLTDDLRVYSDLGTAPTVNYSCSSARYWVRDNEVLQTSANTPYFGKVGLCGAYSNANNCNSPTDLTGAGWHSTAGVYISPNVLTDPMGAALSADRVEFASAGDYIEYDIGDPNDTQASIMIRNAGGANADFDFEIWDTLSSPDHVESETGFTNSHSTVAGQNWTGYYTGTNDTVGNKTVRITAQTAGAKLGIWGLCFDINDTDGIAPNPVTGTAANSDLYLSFNDSTTLPVNDWRLSFRLGGDNVNWFRKANASLNFWILQCGQNGTTDYVGVRGIFRQDELTTVNFQCEVGGTVYSSSASLTNGPIITDVDGDWVDIVLEKSSTNGMTTECFTKAGDVYTGSNPSATLDFNVFAASGTQNMGLLGPTSSPTDTTVAVKGLQISNFAWEDLA